MAWLACMALAACEATAPVEPVEQAGAAPRPAAASTEAARRPVDLGDLLVSEACEREKNRLCAVEALARFVEEPASRELPTAPASGQAGANGSESARLNRQVLHDRLWRLTGAFSPAQVATLAQNHELAPLWRLRQAMSGSRSAHEQAARLQAWMIRWPGHPFVQAPPSSLERLLSPMPQAGRIGLFVPLSGALATAGRAVRDGFIAAYLDDIAPLKSPLRIYDAAAGPIAAIFEQSLADGVDLIVGPLSKQRLEALRRLNPEVAVLGLNYLDRASGGGAEKNRNPRPDTTEQPQLARIAHQLPAADADALATKVGERCGLAPLLQLGLAIEDEAATIMERLLAQDLHRLLAIHGSEDWAVRGVQALTDSWPFDIELQEFTDVKTMTESVGAAMRVDASLARKGALERLLNTELEFLPRARTDLDGVVAFVDHIEATALAPALKFHFAGHLPVYASSQSIRNASRLADLGGFQVAEMPFNLYADPLWDAVQAVFGDGGGNIAALRALGMDAYRIVSHWNWISQGEPVYGATGKLDLGADGKVRRRLAWASVIRGKVQPMAASATP